MDHDAHQAMADMASKQQLSEDQLRKFSKPLWFDAGRFEDPPYAEMACYVPDDQPSTWRLRLLAVVAVVGFVAWVGYWLLPALT